MSIDDTIKSLKEADEKLKKAIVLEQSAIKLQKDAARLRDEAKSDLAKIFAERQGINSLNAVKDAEFSRKDSDLKNREVTLTARQGDLERKTAENDKEFTAREDEITRSDAALQRKVTANKEEKERLDALVDEFKSKAESIAELIRKAL